MTNEEIRRFDQVSGEDAHSFKWSHDGRFIAKTSIKKINVPEGEEVKEPEEEPTPNQVSVYELPSCKLCADNDGNRTSIPVDGVKDFLWFPNKNWIVYTSFPKSENVQPRVTFLEFPSRRQMHNHTIKDCSDMKMYMHPQGNYIAIMNEYLDKKTTKYSVELFDLQDYKGSLPHKQILVQKEEVTFLGVIFEPHHQKIAIHTKSKKVLEAGQKQFSNDPYRTTVDVYQLKHDNLLGFVVKEAGQVPCEKVSEFKFSAAGNIFCTVENEAATRNILTFYLINKVSNEGQTTTVHTSSKKKTDPVNSKQLLSAVDDSYQFIKTARHEVKEKNWFSKWDENGRFFCIYGRKILTDKYPRSVKFYNMFGELIEQYPEIY